MPRDCLYVLTVWVSFQAFGCNQNRNEFAQAPVAQSAPELEHARAPLPVEPVAPIYSAVDEADWDFCDVDSVAAAAIRAPNPFVVGEGDSPPPPPKVEANVEVTAEMETSLYEAVYRHLMHGRNSFTYLVVVEPATARQPPPELADKLSNFPSPGPVVMLQPNGQRFIIEMRLQVLNWFNCNRAEVLALRHTYGQNDHKGFDVLAHWEHDRDDWKIARTAYSETEQEILKAGIRYIHERFGMSHDRSPYKKMSLDTSYRYVPNGLFGDWKSPIDVGVTFVRDTGTLHLRIVRRIDANTVAIQITSGNGGWSALCRRQSNGEWLVDGNSLFDGYAVGAG